MSDLKKQLIKLGSTCPELRPHIREILSKTAAWKSDEDFMEKLANEVASNPPRDWIAAEIHGIGTTNVEVDFKSKHRGFPNTLSVSLRLKRDGYGVDVLVTHMKDWDSQPVKVMEAVERAATTMPVKKLAKNIQKWVNDKLRRTLLT